MVKNPAASGGDIASLTCEGLTNPESIDATHPRLSWQIASEERNTSQTAYHLIVSSSPEKLARNEGDLWNTNKTPTNQSIHILYNGKPLSSRTTCYWKVKVFTNKGETPWSAPAHWTRGLLNTSDWKAHWI
ncbi:MAG TPA: hypothetical protein VLD19_05745, partial [Chitinophagaceae bacterium]|nr:hypothetical protein [Chitinophagaceae bacterium]